MARRSGTRGYTGYRGRRNGTKLLTVLLVLILVLACGFLFAQRYIVYEADGSFRFALPWREEQAQNENLPSGGEEDEDASQDVEVIVEQPKQEVLHAAELDAAILSGGWEEALDALPEDVNAVAIRLKDAGGKLLYDSALESAIDCGAVAGGRVAHSAIEGITHSDYYTIARISTLHDSIYAYAHMTDAAICQLTGFVWYDTNSTHWLAPEKAAARQYISDIAAECAQRGFDELLLDELHYPRDGRMSRIKTDERTMTQSEALALLLDEIRTALKAADYEGKLSVSVDADIVLAGSEERTGIVMSELCEKVDRVYVAVEEDELVAVAEAMEGLEAEFVPILAQAGESGSWLIGR